MTDYRQQYDYGEQGDDGGQGDQYSQTPAAYRTATAATYRTAPAADAPSSWPMTANLVVLVLLVGAWGVVRFLRKCRGGEGGL